ncbi:hypothetical protein NVP1081O_064 [Vibrio phage 1.081.O._10N.286.52.C2]|nr:hypothetical protein NVP1081O_064 [Vibrio phage 1.081.O._10N.286.52.C2]
MTAYKVKKMQCKRREIAFNFTKPQWDTLINLKTSMRCAYTNHPFSPQGPMSATVERIDESKPYEPGNCVLVTQLANQLKADYIENDGDESKADKNEIHVLGVIRRVLGKPEKMKDIVQTYLDHYKGPIASTESSDLDIAELYCKYSRKAQRNGVAFQITLGQFKRAVSRSTCQVSKVHLPDIKHRVVRVLDSSKPVTLDNIQVTSQAIDAIMNQIESIDMTASQKRTFMTSIGAK